MDEYNNNVKNMAKTHTNNTNNFGNHHSHYGGGYRQDTHVNNSLSQSDSIVISKLFLFIQSNFSQVLSTIQELSRFKNGRIGRHELLAQLEKKNLSNGQIAASIRNLGDNGYLFEEDDYYCLQ